ncbi:MAG: glycosyltransferase family 2 protein [Lysobacterales bacterium]
MDLSIVIPVYNEVDNLDSLARQVFAALNGVIAYQLVIVDDGSADASQQELARLQSDFPITVVTHPANVGQSAAICSGVGAATAEWIATLDGDLQNDPADIPRLFAAAKEASHPVLVAGNRVNRQDNWIRRASSRVANRIRRWALADDCPDTGCSLKVFRRADFLILPQFDHMHRFLPALFAAQGVPIINLPVNHRPRQAGVSKYGVGNRLWVGITDMLGVRWLRKRRFSFNADQRLEQRRDE